MPKHPEDEHAGTSVDIRKSILKSSRTPSGGEIQYPFHLRSKSVRMSSGSRVYTLDAEDLAGPMLESDILHTFTLFCALASGVMCAVSLWFAAWFTHYDTAGDHLTNTLKIQHYKLWDISKCDVSGIVCYLGAGERTTKPFALGTWILTEKVAASAGTALVVINIVLQIVNWLFENRSLAIQTQSMWVISAAAAVLTFAGGVAQIYSVWQEPERDVIGNVLVVCGGAPGLLLLSVLPCVTCAVFTHVASHGPGALSKTTRFLYRRRSTAPSDSVTKLPTLKARPATVGMDEEEPERSTAV